LGDAHVKISSTIQPSKASLACVAIVWLTTLVSRGSDPSSINLSVFRDGSSDEVFVVNDATTNALTNKPINRGTKVSVVESNGLYSIDIDIEPAKENVCPNASKVDRPDETVPPSINDCSLDISQMLAIYAKFTGAELDIGEGVRQVADPIYLKSTPAMTRAQVVDLVDDLLLKAGVVVTHPDSKHAVFRLKQ
jgi:hypothetical protein